MLNIQSHLHLPYAYDFSLQMQARNGPNRPQVSCQLFEARSWPGREKGTIAHSAQSLRTSKTSQHVVHAQGHLLSQKLEAKRLHWWRGSAKSQCDIVPDVAEVDGIWFQKFVRLLRLFSEPKYRSSSGRQENIQETPRRPLPSWTFVFGKVSSSASPPMP